MTSPEAWPELLGLGSLYGLAGALFRDSFSFEGEPRWTEAWREGMRASGAGGALEPESAALLSAFEETRARGEEARLERSRLFLQGGCPAYETSYVFSLSRTQELADIAGFYRAFGVRTDGEREDHLAVECEFASFLCVKEAIARASRRSEEADRCRDARGAFLKDHIGTWLSLYEADLRSRQTLPMLASGVAALRAIVRLDATRLGVDVTERTRPESEDDETPITCAPSATNLG